jgi:hypothetical protein
MTPYEESQLLSMMQQMMADIACAHAQMLADIANTNACLAQLKNNTQELQSEIHNS